MPVILSAKKKVRADARKEQANQKVKAVVKTTLKKFKAAPTAESLKHAYSVLDVAAKKGIIPKMRADRKKSRLSSFLSKKGAIKVARPKPKGSKGKAKQKRSSQNG